LLWSSALKRGSIKNGLMFLGSSLLGLSYVRHLLNFHRIPTMYFNAEVSPKPKAFWGSEDWCVGFVPHNLLARFIADKRLPANANVLPTYVLIILASICVCRNAHRNPSKKQDDFGLSALSPRYCGSCLYFTLGRILLL